MSEVINEGLTSADSRAAHSPLPPEDHSPFLEALFQQHGNGILLCGYDGRIFSANRAACRIFGRSEAELIAVGGRALFTPMDAMQLWGTRAEGSPGFTPGELTALRPDGAHFPVHVSMASFTKEGVHYATLLIRDMTSSRRSYEQLEDSERKYRLLVENVNDGIVISQDEHFIYFNRRFAEMLGYDTAELHQLTYQDVYTPRGLEILLKRGEKRDRKEEVPPRYETEFKRKDGRVITVEANVTIIPYQSRLATFAVIRDITEERRIQLHNEIFGQLGINLSRAESLEQVAKFVGEATDALFGWHAIYFAVRHSGRTRFRAYLRADTMDDNRRVYYPVKDWDLTPEAFVSKLTPGVPVLLNRDPRELGYVVTPFGNRDRPSASRLYAGMHRHGSLLGSFSIQSYTPYRYSEKDAEVLQRIADLVQPTVERFLAEIRTMAFTNLGQKLGSVTNPEEVARIIINLADRLIGWDAAFLDLYHPDTQRVESLVNMDIVDGERRDVPPSLSNMATSDLENRLMQKGSLLIRRDIDDSQHFVRLQTFGDHQRRSETLIFVPIKGAKRTIGFLSIQSYTPNAYDQEDVRILEALANHCSGALERTRASRQLRKSEQRYRTVVDTVETLIVVLDTEGRIQEWNRNAERIFDFHKDEVLGQDYFKLAVPEDERENVVTAFKRAIAGNMTGVFQNAVIRRDGSRKYIMWNTRRLVDEEGRCTGLLCCGLDITERRHYEEELQRNEAQYRAIVEDQTELILRFLPDGTLTFANEACCQYFRMTRDKLLQRRLLDFVPFQQHRIVQDNWLSLDSKRPFSVIQHRVQLPEGEIRWNEWTHRILFDGAGEVVGYQAAGRDITALKDAQEALRASQERFLKLLDASSDVIFQLNLDGHVEYTNPACELVFGYSPNEFLDDPAKLHELIHSSCRERFENAWKEFRDKGRFAEDLEPWAWTRRDGEIIYTENLFSYLYNNEGNVGGLLFTCRDVSERLRLEGQRRELEGQIAQTQKLESMSVLAGGIAHDFNNLLTGILGNAGLVLDQLNDDSSMFEYVTQIQTAALRASELTKQMLAYAGKGKFIVQSLNLSLIVRETGGLLQSLISRRAQVIYDLQMNLPYIEADATQIRQVVMNIMTNASDALEGNDGIITLRTATRHFDDEELDGLLFGSDLPGGDYIVLSISDTGCGLDEETRQRMFDPFFTRKPTGLVGGRGLGLAAVLGIVRNHRGAIQVESQVGMGTTFMMVFPKSAPSQGLSLPQPTLPTPIPVGPAPKFTGTILVVDDEDIVRRVAKGALTRVGYTVLQACDGIDALEQFDKNSEEISAVLLDLKMPRMSGEEAFRELRARKPNLPIVLMSGYTEQEVSDLFAGHQPAAFLEKPFSPSDLIARITKSLGHKNH